MTPSSPVAAPPSGSAAALTTQERIAALTGVILALLLAGLDQTIVSTAGPAIQRDLAIPASLYAWITSAYLVSSTVMVPIYGKLSDILGRKPVLLVGIGIFLFGSLLCGLAPTALTLIAFRAVQGLGAAALFTSAFAVIADLFPPAERGRYQGLIAGVFGLSSVIGPLVGGFITDRFGWHWIFFVNLPIGAAALWFIITKMPRFGARGGQREPLDLAGAAWLVTAVVPLMVALSLGRAQPAAGDGGYGWGSWQILGMFAVALVGAVAFVRTERRAPDPLLHLELFADRVIGLSTLAAFLLGAAFLSAIVFLPLFLVNVVGISATRAGLTMMPLTLGVVAGSIAAGQIVTRAGRYKRLLVGSVLLLMLGFAVMGFTLTPGSTSGEVTLKMIFMGLGMGPSMPLLTLSAQNVARLPQLGVVTAAVTFSRSLGQVIGVALLGTVFATSLTAAVGREAAAVLAPLSAPARALVATAVPQSTAAPVGEGASEGAAALAFDTTAVRLDIRRAAAAHGHEGPAPAAAEVDEALAAVAPMAAGFARAFTSAITALFRLGLLVAGLALIVSLLIPDVPLRRHHEDVAPPPPLE